MRSKTLRKYVWPLIVAMASLEAHVVSFWLHIRYFTYCLISIGSQSLKRLLENRFKNDKGICYFTYCLISIGSQSLKRLLENRFKNDKGNDCLLNVDGTDFQDL